MECVWIALYIFSAFKGAAGFVLLIVGAILMSHTADGWCKEVKECLEKLGYIDLYMDSDSCQTDMDLMSSEAGNWGTALLVIGLFGMLTSGFAAVGSKKKNKAIIIVSACVDGVFFILSIAMALLCSFVATLMLSVCDSIKQRGISGVDEDYTACWSSFTDSVCAWSEQFGTASLMFIVMLIVTLGCSIADCAACCCCPPADAPWNTKFNQGGQGQVVGQVIGQPVEANGSKPA